MDQGEVHLVGVIDTSRLALTHADAPDQVSNFDSNKKTFNKNRQFFLKGFNGHYANQSLVIVMAAIKSTLFVIKGFNNTIQSTCSDSH